MTGSQLRDQGVDDVLSADIAPHRNYGAHCRDAIDALASSGREFTAEDVRRFVAVEHPDAFPHHPNVLPAILGTLAKSGEIVAVGMVRTTRSSRHSSRNLVWRAAA